MAYESTDEPERESLWIHGLEFILDKQDKARLDALFPTDSRQVRNHTYPAIHTHTPEGDRCDVYIRRVIADFILRDEGKSIAKGFTVEVRDGDPTNLTRANLKLVFNKDRSEGEIKRKNGFQTHRIISIRLRALDAGLNPDEAIREARND